MKLKTFRAASMAQALVLVKRDLGTDAVIVQTRTLKKGGLLGLGAKNLVEITARSAQAGDAPKRENNDRLRRLYNLTDKVELSNKPKVVSKQEPGVSSSSRFQVPSSKLKTEAINPKPGTLNLELGTSSEPKTHNPVVNNQLAAEMGQLRALVENLVREHRKTHAPQMPDHLFELYLDLIQKEVADELAREMISQVQEEMTGNQLLSAHLVRQRLLGIMENMITTAGPICRNVNGGARIVALIGPTGVGKTTTIAKLAANYKLRQNKKVGLITIDTYRIGAVDQLRMYAQIIDVPLKVVLTPAELKEAVAQMRDLDLILIDTAGRSQHDQLKIKELQTFLDAAGPHEVHLVLSSTSHHTSMLSAAEEFKKVGVDRIILTKLDEAISFGVVLSVIKKVDASISYITTGQDVPDDIEVGNGRRLAKLLLGMEGISTSNMQHTVG